MLFNETCKISSLPGPHDTDSDSDIFMVMGSKVKVTEIIFFTEAFGSVVCHQRQSISDW